MPNYKLSKELKNRMGRELRQYYTNKKNLEELKKNKKMATRQFLYIEQRLSYVENVYNRLNSFEQEVFNLIFKENCNFVYAEVNKNISKTTYYNIYNKCVYLLAEEWGEV